MNNTHNWKLLEKVADPATDADERLRLLEEIESNPGLLAQWKAFRVLQTWPESLNQKDEAGTPDSILLRINEENSVDRGIRRMFPYVATAALAASIILAFMNIGQTDDPSEITIDDVFGLPETTVENAILESL